MDPHRRVQREHHPLHLGDRLMMAGAPIKRRRAMTGMHRAQREVPAPTQRLFLTRRETAIELRMSLAKLDRVIARGELKAKKHGHSVVVMASEITRYIEQWPDVKPRAVRGAR